MGHKRRDIPRPSRADTPTRRETASHRREPAREMPTNQRMLTCERGWAGSGPRSIPSTPRQPLCAPARSQRPRSTEGRSLPSHADQSQRLVDLADLLVVAWDGHPPRGPGGVADTVARARRADIEVIWAAPDGAFGLRYARGDGTWATDAVFTRTRGLALARDLAGSHQD